MAPWTATPSAWLTITPADNHTRLTALTYPDARKIDYTYGSANSVDDALSRVAAIQDGAATLASYTYLGGGRPVRVDYEQPQVMLDQWGGTAGTYDGIDRFGRVTDHRWRNYGASTDADRIRHGYDRNSNRLWRENVIAAIEDELYVYDALDRLVDIRRGVLNANKDAIATLEFAQDWSLDPVGNWTVFRQDDDGDSTWNLDQTRSHSLANEIDTISGGWTDPVHDAAGNMTTVPQPADPTSGYTATYDAWNRLVKLEDGTDTVAEYTYDGRGRRIIKKTYDGGVVAETRHLYYTNGWQVIEERIGSAEDAERQFVWGGRYADDLILRDRDADPGAPGLDERRYALQDANFNVTTIIDATGAVTERYRYTAYGEGTFLDANFTAQTGNESPTTWEVLYAGYRFDADSHLYHVRHRVLHPVLGRWLQRDPLGYVDGMSLYQYVGSSPLIYLDPDGQAAIIIVCGIAVFVYSATTDVAIPMHEAYSTASTLALPGQTIYGTAQTYANQWLDTAAPMSMSDWAAAPGQWQNEHQGITSPGQQQMFNQASTLPGTLAPITSMGGPLPAPPANTVEAATDVIQEFVELGLEHGPNYYYSSGGSQQPPEGQPSSCPMVCQHDH